ncbi:hypothetical protein [Pseudobutyrivibrio sp.]
MTELITELLVGQGDNYILPFFWQHGESEETIRKYMQAIYDANIRAVCIESRPHPDFCGEMWWHDMDIILDEARKKKMKVWILDDSHFPTGYANGAMVNQPVELHRQSVCCRTIACEYRQIIELEEELVHPVEFQKSMVEQFVMQEEPRKFDDDRLLSVYALKKKNSAKVEAGHQEIINLASNIHEGKLVWQVPEGQWNLYIVHLSRNFGYHRDYINMMDKDSCRVLIDAVYEPHYAHYKDEFGKTIAGFFSDEPELGNGHLYETDDGFGKASDFPWSSELERKLEQEIGSDFALYLNALWDNELVETEKIRYAYMDAVTELIKKNFSMQIGEWCRQRGVQYIGHLIEDDNHHTKTGASLGHYYRGLAGQDMSGIDDIGGQVFPQGEDINYNNGIFEHRNGQFYHYMLGKLGSSAAAIEPLKQGNSMCEIFGNYGWSEGVRLEKYLVDHFMVRGINHFVPHAFSGKEYPDPDCPPHFYAHGNNPQYRHFGQLMAYVNRVCHLISNGRHISQVAVLYHGEGEWTGKYMTSDVIGRILTDSQIDYDYIPQDVFANRDEYKTKIQPNELQVNLQKYQVVIVPYMEYVTKAFADAVVEMANHQIEVLFVNAFPQGICDAKKEDCCLMVEKMKTSGKMIELENVSDYLDGLNIREVHISPSNNRIRYLHYVHNSGESIWLFVNEGTEAYKGKICIDCENSMDDRNGMYIYDAWENSISAIRRDANTVDVLIEPLKSLLLIDDPDASKAEIEKLQKSEVPSYENGNRIPFVDTWKRSLCRSIDYPKFSKEKEVSIPDSLEVEEPDFSGFCRYDNRFEGRKGTRTYLELEDAYEGVEVFLNQKSMGIQISPPFRYDFSEYVVDGMNELVIEVATTLERENAHIPNVMGQIVEAKSKSGITGEIILWEDNF